MNWLEYFENEKISIFYISLFEYCAIALINKLIRVAKKSATITNNDITTSIFDESIKKGIIKSNLLDHLWIFFSISTLKFLQNSSLFKLKQRIFNENKLASFKDQISKDNCNNLNSTQCSANGLYEIFLNTCNEMYNVSFPLSEVDIKPKNLKKAWLSKGQKKSKTKQRIFIKFVKNNREKYKNYKSLFK